MKKPTFYEQVGIIIPGSLLLFGLLFFFPPLRDFLLRDGVTVGQFGIYVLLAYAAGHLIAAVGNAFETLIWRLFGGMPTDWITKEDTSLISPQQRDLVEARIRSRLGLPLDSVRGLDRKIWFPISRQLYADVARYGRPDRIEIFNGNYGLNRGLASSCLLLGVVAAVMNNWWAVLTLCALALVYAYRAYRFGVHYGRELYMQFLIIGDMKASPCDTAEQPAQR